MGAGDGKRVGGWYPSASRLLVEVGGKTSLPFRSALVVSSERWADASKPVMVTR
jgi:hypothetical protein